MRFRHAAQQDFDAGCVQLDHGGEIKDELGTVHAEKRFDLLPEFSRRTSIHPLGHALHDNGSANRLHTFSLPPDSMETRWPNCSREPAPGLPRMVLTLRSGRLLQRSAGADVSVLRRALARAMTTHLLLR